MTKRINIKMRNHGVRLSFNITKYNMQFICSKIDFLSQHCKPRWLERRVREDDIPILARWS